MGGLDSLLSPADQARVVAAVQAAEKRTSGEIKVHIDRACPIDAWTRAKELFVRLGLTKTRQRNGVLVYVAVDDRKLAILGDVAIHDDVGETFWQEALELLRDAFKRGAYADGLVAAVKAVGSRLAERFPAKPGDENEISDDISTGEGEPEKK